MFHHLLTTNTTLSPVPPGRGVMVNGVYGAFPGWEEGQGRGQWRRKESGEELFGKLESWIMIFL